LAIAFQTACGMAAAITATNAGVANPGPRHDMVRGDAAGLTHLLIDWDHFW
jgi:hypothetical protein